MRKEKEYTFSYNSPLSCQSPVGMKRKTLNAFTKTEAKIKIKEFLQNFNGVLCIEYF